MTIDPIAPPPALAQQETSGAPIACCPSCDVRPSVGEEFCHACGVRLGDAEGAEAHAAPARLTGTDARRAGALARAPGGHRRPSRALLSGGVPIALIAVAGGLALTLGSFGSTLSRELAWLAVVLLGILAVSGAAMVIALALCRTAAAGDRAVVDDEQAPPPGAEERMPIPFAGSAWIKDGASAMELPLRASRQRAEIALSRARPGSRPAGPRISSGGSRADQLRPDHRATPRAG
jgi:hypothetical protein